MSAKKKKPPVRQVRVDEGYGPAEHWVTVKAIDERRYMSVFSEPRTELLVEYPGGRRDWVAFWEEIEPKSS